MHDKTDIDMIIQTLRQITKTKQNEKTSTTISDRIISGCMDTFKLCGQDKIDNVKNFLQTTRSLANHFPPDRSRLDKYTPVKVTQKSPNPP